MDYREIFPMIFRGICQYPPPDGIAAVQGFNPAKYLGTWHEIARLDHFFERGLTHVTASYAQNPNGTISIENRGFDPASGKWKKIGGTGRFQKAPDIGSLSVTFFWPLCGVYHVFALADDYSWALVTGPSREYLWMLARTPQIPDSLRAQLIEKARTLGFAVDNLIFVDQAS